MEVAQTFDQDAVDCDVLLASKENIQPLHKGRSARVLSAVFSTPLIRRDAHLAKQREWHKLQVKEAQDEPNPLRLLEAYDQFINWTIENYPQGESADSGIVELIEEATRLLKEKDSPAINQNETYLRMWLLYADYVERPTIVYAFLLSNEIGTNHSIFYESYADELERFKRNKEADEIYSLGIARKATPTVRLETRYRGFKRRMLNGCIAGSGSPELDIESPTPSSSSHSRPPAPKKKILGSSSLTANGSSHTTPFINTSSVKPKSKPNSLIIFSDEDAAEGGAEASPWSDIGKKKSRTKENTRAVTKAGDGVPLLNPKFQARRIVSTPVRSAFVPFEDENAKEDEFEGLPETTGGGLLALNSPNLSQLTALEAEEETPNSLLRAKAPTQLTESEALKKDPLKNYTQRSE